MKRGSFILRTTQYHGWDEGGREVSPHLQHLSVPLLRATLSLSPHDLSHRQCGGVFSHTEKSETDREGDTERERETETERGRERES
jgi:hypothetical protein